MTIHIGSPITLLDVNLRAMSAAGPKFGDDRLPNSAAQHAAIRDAAQALGLSQNQYKAKYGQPRRLAESLLRSSSREAS